MELTLNLTHACNLACSYCNAGDKFASAMDLETGRAGIRLALDELEASGGPRVLEVAFFGGEPLLEFDLLVQLADDARDQAGARGVIPRFSVTTNGTLLDLPRARALGARGFHLGLSLDGAQAAQDTTRRFAGGRSSAATVWRALDLALDQLERVSVISVVDPSSVQHLADGVTRIVEAGVRRLTLNPNWLASWPPDRFVHWESAYRQIAELWCARHREQAPFELNTIDAKIWARLTEDLPSSGGCGFGRSELAIAPSGRIYPCGRVVGEDPDDPQGRAHCIGTLASGLDDASRAARTAPVPLPAECRSCAYLSRCANRCGCSNLEASGDAGTPSGVLCWHETLSIGLADQAASTLYAERNPSFLSTFYSEVCA